MNSPPLASPVASPHAPPHAVACLKDAAARSVWLVRRPGEEPRTLKTWPLTASLILKLAVGQAQPQRQARMARRLRAAGIPTPRVVRGPTVVRRGGRRLVELELEHIEGEMPLDLLRSASSAAQVAAARAVGALLAQLVAARFFNRDLKLSNVVIARDDAGGALRAWLLDPVGVRRMTSPRSQTARMLERLAVEPRAASIPIRRDVAREVIRAVARA
ncbi:MAG: lipopolysaccharide kinase InaA family protein [Phycisphaerales bacterium]